MHSDDRSELRVKDLDDPAVFRALGHPLRAKILARLEEARASAKQLSDELEETPGRIGHHLRTLARAGLVEVVEERPVRAVVERFYAPTYDRLAFPAGDGAGRVRFLLQQAEHLIDDAVPPLDPPGRLYTVRMPAKKAATFAARLVALADEFGDAGEEEGPVFAFAGAVFQTGVGDV
jgi:DNA-binding transcriptional ArsR family regulator